jgi:hypothetical protein
VSIVGLGAPEVGLRLPCSLSASFVGMHHAEQPPRATLGG